MSEKLQQGAGDGASLQLNHWSFGQVCRLAGVSRDTVNRLSAATTAQIFEETLSRIGNKPIRIFAENNRVRSVHAASYTRLFKANLLMMREFAMSFEPPQLGMNGASGLYAGEQGVIIDSIGWTESDGLLSLEQQSRRPCVGISRSGFKRSARTTSSGLLSKWLSSPATIRQTFMICWHQLSSTHNTTGPSARSLPL